jgi:hypothetical protein
MLRLRQNTLHNSSIVLVWFLRLLGITLLGITGNLIKKHNIGVMIHSFLMIGQSNMAGRGFLKDVHPIYDERIKMLRNGRWQNMTEPINYDRPTSGASLAASFAAAWRKKNQGETIGLIPCADGGSSLDDWAVGGALFDHAVQQAKLAQRSSQLVGILWHQGENDSFGGRANQYLEKLSVIIDALRRELDVPNTPLIIGGLGDYLPNGRFGSYFAEYTLINQALQEYANSFPNIYFVTAAGLTANPDQLHFDAASQRKFGIRYFDAFHHHKNVLRPVKGEEDTLNLIYNRPLSKTEQVALLENKFASGVISLADFELQLGKLSK